MGSAAVTLDGAHDARVLLLGPVRLLDAQGDDAVTSSAGQRRLVAAITTCDGLARTDWLCETLGLTPTALRTAISRLRSRLPADVLVTDGAGYRMVAPCDADAFLAMIDGSGAGADRLATLDDALALWSGAALEEFAHEPWAEATAARLNEVRIAASEERAALLIALGRSEAAVPVLETLAAANPLRDRIHGLLMQALAANEREVDALRAYQAHRSRLIEEAGVEPALAVREIEQRIASGGSDERRMVAQQLYASGRWPVDRDSEHTRFAHLQIPALGGPATNISALHNRLVGRGDEVGQVRAALAESRLVTITGPGGVGKTRLAREVGLLEADRTEEGVWFVDLSTAATGPQILAAVAEACRFPLAGPDPEAALLDFLTVFDAVLILDNCEHLVDEAAGFVGRLLDRPGRSRVLATSREFLDLAGEAVVRLPSLASERATDPAVELFVERATAVNPAFQADDAARATIAELCARLDGLPLAIELAAARSNVLAPRQLVEGLDRRFDLLRGGRRRRSMPVLEETLAWSYDLLDPSEKQVFRSLGCFAGSFTADAAADVAGVDGIVALEIVESLIAKSMVVAASTPVGVRFSLLETTQAYARRLLVADDELAVARARHLDHYLGRCAPYLTVWTAKVGDTGLEPDADNLRAAARHGADEERWEDAAQLLHAGWPVLATHPGDFESQAAECARHLPPDSETAATLGFARMLVAIENDDPTTLSTVLPTVAVSPVPRARLLRSANKAVMIARLDPAGALALSEHIASRLEQTDLPVGGDEVRIVLLYAAVAAHNGRADHGRVVEASRALDEAIRRAEGATTLHAWALAAEAVAHVALGNRPAAVSIQERLDGIDNSWIAADELRMLLHLDDGAVESAVALLRPYCHEAVSGRFTRHATAAVIYLAFLAYAEGDVDRSLELVQGIDGVSAMQAQSALHLLCERLGVDPPPQRAANEEMRAVRERQREVLAAELDRRRWSDR